MTTYWEERKSDWLKRTNLSEESSSWAIESAEQTEKSIQNLEGEYLTKKLSDKNIKDLENELKGLQKSIRKSISAKESDLDDISLSPPNSYKLQVSTPSNLAYLMKVWAAAEGRDLSSVALQCIEIGLLEMKSKGSIPSAALSRYNLACEKRIALAQVNNLWERHQEAVINAIT